MVPEGAAEETVLAVTNICSHLPLPPFKVISCYSTLNLVRAERLNHTDHFLFLEGKVLLLKVLTQLSDRVPLSPYCSIPQRTVLVQIMNNSRCLDFRGAMTIFIPVQDLPPSVSMWRLTLRQLLWHTASRTVQKRAPTTQQSSSSVFKWKSKHFGWIIPRVDGKIEILIWEENNTWNGFDRNIIKWQFPQFLQSSLSSA